MKVLLQRVLSARVDVAGTEVASIGHGLLLFACAERGDPESACCAAARKLGGLRVFADPAGHMNLDVLQVGGEILLVPQFTLAASLRRGRRPSFEGAADPEIAAGRLELFARELRALGLVVREGRFGADMQVTLVSDGPVTFLLDLPPAFPAP